MVARVSIGFFSALTLIVAVTGINSFAADMAKIAVPSKVESATGIGAANSELSRVRSHRMVDLTQKLEAGLPNFHGGSDSFQYKKLFSVEKDGYANGSFCTMEHYGTHIDAPSHFDKNGQSIEQIPPERLILPGVVIDVRKEVSADPDYLLSKERILQFEKNAVIPDGAAIFLLTGWSDRWPDQARYRNEDAGGQMHFPGFSGDAAAYLVNERHAAMLGIDTLSLDRGMSNEYPVHKLALPKGVLLTENLTRLADLPDQGTLIFCGPLRITGGTGSPARIMAILP